MTVDEKLKQKSLGDAVWELAMEHAAYVNGSEVISLWRQRHLPLARYVKHIAAMYPVVVGFNRALIHSIGKLDNVRDSGIVAGLAEQLLEEQEHNDIWRSMLSIHGVDHEVLYTRLLEYIGRFSQPRMTTMAAEVVAALKENRSNIAPGVFVNSPFPEPVIALYHHMFIVASSDEFSFWCQFASQSAIEATIYEVVSTSIYPGTVGHAELDRGGKSVSWWREHARAEADGGKPTTEEKHLYLSRRALNKAAEANAVREQLLAVVDNSLYLFAASIVAHNAGYDVPVPHDALPEAVGARKYS